LLRTANNFKDYFFAAPGM